MSMEQEHKHGPCVCFMCKSLSSVCESGTEDVQRACVCVSVAVPPVCVCLSRLSVLCHLS